MFIHNLNTDQQSALLYLAKQVASADGSDDELQFGMFDVLTKQSHAEAKEQKIELSELSTVFNTERAKGALLLELLGIALANDEYHQNEQELIHSYATHLDISNEKLAQLENWVRKQFLLSAEAEELLN